MKLQKFYLKNGPKDSFASFRVLVWYLIWSIFLYRRKVEKVRKKGVGIEMIIEEIRNGLLKRWQIHNSVSGYHAFYDITCIQSIIL